MAGHLARRMPIPLILATCLLATVVSAADLRPPHRTPPLWSTTARGRKDRPGSGTPKTPGAVVRTQWNTGEIWLRRTIELAVPLPPRAALRLHHDEDAQVYLTGDLVLSRSGYTTEYESEEIDVRTLRPGRNVLAIHCRRTIGGRYIDAGIDAILPDTK